MPSTGDRKRLSLVRPRTPTPPFPTRVTGPGFVVGVAEAEIGAGASSWAVELALAMPGVTHFVCCAFGERAPVVDASAVEALSGQGITVLSHAVPAAPEGLAGVFAELGASPRWVCVGEPALALLEPDLAVLITGGADVRNFPPALLQHLPAYPLVVELVRPGLAKALAARL